jgi:hypothetical protein
MVNAIFLGNAKVWNEQIKKKLIFNKKALNRYFFIKKDLKMGKNAIKMAEIKKSNSL